MAIATINPYTGETLKTFPSYTADEIEKRIATAHAAYCATTQNLAYEQKQREKVLFKAAQLLEDRKQELGKLITLEMGKTLISAIQEIEKCALNCRYYAENGLKYLEPQRLQGGEHRHLPLGIVLAIMPWNFPFWQVFRGAAPILLSGNSFVLKHASNVPQCALAIEKIFVDAGLEKGAFQTLLVGSDAIEKLIADPRIAGVTLTGSEGAGRSVAAQAGKVIKKSVMELGGSDPFIVMPSADITLAAETAVKARLICNGQSCIAAKRFIIHAEVYESFKSKFVSLAQSKALGDPMMAQTDLGPLVSVKAREELHDLVKDAAQKGAKILIGGEAPEGKGALYPATVIENITSEMTLYSEEAFGPVAALYRVKDLNEAITLANATRFGLGSSFWSTDKNEIEQAKRLIEAGSVFINKMVASDPKFAFGGVKSSGYGRELGEIGMLEFTNLKTVVE